MSDITERLRRIADAGRRADGSDIPLGEQLREAAAEIERLRADAVTFQSNLDALANLSALYGRQRDEARAARRDDGARIVEQMEEIAELRAALGLDPLGSILGRLELVCPRATDQARMAQDAMARIGGA